jgi:predicted Zn-dependent peptidase
MGSLVPSARRLRHRFALGLCSVLALACHPPSTSDAPGPTVAPPPVAAASVAEILAASDLPPEQPEPLPGDPMGVTVHRLGNGMTVYISTNRQEPRFSAWIAVRTGSRNDPADSTGLAHYLEHMLFKGTDELGTLDIDAERPHLARIAELYDELRKTDEPGARAEIFTEIDRRTQATAAWAIPEEMSRIYGLLGIEGFNAFTDDDSTVYEADVPSNRLRAFAVVEVERFQDAEFRLFYPELEAVYEEKNKSIDEPWDQIDEAIRVALFPGHPYGTQPTIGRSEHLETPAYGDMVAYHQRWYAPNNMAILLAGDIDAATALPVLEETLGTLEPRPLEASTPGDLAPSRGRAFREVLAEGEESVTIGWRTVGGTDPDEPTITVLDRVLDNATSGLLNLELELTQKVPDASSWSTHMREAGYFNVSATAREGQSLEEVERLLLEVVAKLRAGEVEPRTIEAILLHEDIDDKQRLESNEGRVAKLHEAYIGRRTWQAVLERDARLRRITKADVVAAANRYLGEDFAVVYRRRGTPELPKIDKPKLTPVEVDDARESAFSRKIAAMPATPLEPEWLVEGKHYERRTLTSGPLVAAKNTRNDLYHVSFVIERGHRKDRLLCHGLRLLELSGNGGKSAEALRDELYALGTSIDFYCDADETWLIVRGLDRTMEASLGLLREWLRGATFDATTLAGLTENTLSERRDMLDDPAALEYMLHAHALYGQDSSYMVEPSNRELLAAKPKALAKLVRGLLDYRRRTYYFGPRAADAVTEVLALGGGTREPGKFLDTEYRKVTEPTIYFVHKEVAKAAITLAIPQGVLEPERRAEGRLLGEYLDGNMGSLLYLEIREARGLVYTTGGYEQTGSRPGDEWAFLGHMETQAEKTVEAVKTYLEVIRRPLTKVRLAAAKESMEQYFLGSRIDPRQVPSWVRDWDLLGEPGDPRPKQREAMAALDVSGLEPMVATLRAPSVIAIVGDRRRVDLEGLGTLGKVVEVEAGALTSFGAFPVRAR